MKKDMSRKIERHTKNQLGRELWKSFDIATTQHTVEKKCLLCFASASRSQK